MSLNAYRSTSLVNNLHCCKKILALNKQLTGIARKMCSIVNLFLVVHSDQQIATQPTQNNLLARPDKVLTQRRRSLKEDGFQLTWSQCLMQLQRNLANEQWKNMCSVFSEAPHNAHLSEPGPFLFLIWSAAGSLRQKVCHMKILILGGIWANQISLNFTVRAPEISLAYAD